MKNKGFDRTSATGKITTRYLKRMTQQLLLMRYPQNIHVMKKRRYKQAYISKHNLKRENEVAF